MFISLTIIISFFFFVVTFFHRYRIADSLGEILKGLRCYFDKALPVILLYKNERHQYEESFSDDVSPSTVYGAEHLLRLFGIVVLLC